MIKIVLTAIGVVVVIMAVVGVAAKDAHPGDVLYSYKLNVREPVLYAFHTTQAQRGLYEIELLQSRYQDLLISLASSNSQNTGDATTAFSAAQQAVAVRIERASSSKDLVPLASDLVSESSALLRTYGAMVSLMATQSGQEKLALQITTLQTQHQDLQSGVAKAFADSYNKESLIRRFDDRSTEVHTLHAQAQNQFALLPVTTSKEMVEDITAVLKQADIFLAQAHDRHDRDLDPEGYILLNSAAENFKAASLHMHIAGTFPMPKLSR